MPTKFEPHGKITPKMVHNLMAIEALKEKIPYIPLTSESLILTSLRKAVRLYNFGGYDF